MRKLQMLQPRVAASVSGKVSTTFNDERRIRGHALQKIRAVHLARHPLCVRCLAKQPPVTRVATELDHVIPIVAGGADTLDPFENRQGLCDECHVEKTNEDASYRPVPVIA